MRLEIASSIPFINGGVMKITDITKEVEAKEKARNRIDFQTELRKVYAEGNILTDRKAIIRTDTNQILGIVGENYKFLRHEEVLETLTKKLPIELTERSITVCKNGSVMFAKFNTPKILSAEIKKDDIVNFGLEIFNSYDGSLQVGFMLTANRLSCLNGMVIPRSIAHVSAKHTSEINLSKVESEFRTKLNLYTKAVDKWRVWNKISLKETKAEGFLRNKVGRELKEELIGNYKSEKDQTVWGFFNILTSYNTHRIKTRQNNEQNRRISQMGFEKKIITPFYNNSWN